MKWRSLNFCRAQLGQKLAIRFIQKILQYHLILCGYYCRGRVDPLVKGRGIRYAQLIK